MPHPLDPLSSPPAPTHPKSLGTVLVIGGCGFLGRHVVSQLLNFPSEKSKPPQTLSLGPNTGRYAYEIPSLSSRYPSYDTQVTRVHALDLRCPEGSRETGCTYHECDITDREGLIAVFKSVQPDVVVNTASPQFDAPGAVLHRVNVLGTRTLLAVAGDNTLWASPPATDTAVKKRCKAFVHTSSSSVIHDASSDLCNADERYPLEVPNNREYYSETKAIAEVDVLRANGRGGMLTAAVRPAGIIGEGDRGGIAYGWCANAADAPGWQSNLQIGGGG